MLNRLSRLKTPSTLLTLLVLLVSMAGSSAATFRTFKFKSPALGTEQSAQIFVPSTEPPLHGWPVLYLLHGLNGAPADWDMLGDLGTTLDRLIASGRIRPMLVVMPTGRNSWYVDSASVGGPGDFATAVTRDLPAAIEAAFPVGKDREDRAIGGISMGGYGALRIGLSMPDRYVAVAALSPALWQNIPIAAGDAAAARHDRAPTLPYVHRFDADIATTGIDMPPEGSHFGNAFGTPFDPKRFNAATVFTALQRAIENRTPLPKIYLSVGDDDSHHLWRGAIAFFETMEANNKRIEFRVTDGDHNWTLWKRSIVDALAFVDGAFGRAPSH